jgi:hypothetical protein
VTYISWGCLAGNVDVARYYDAGLDVDDTANGEDDNAVTLGDGVAKGPGAGVAALA